jgi:hypothetical protein
VPLHLEGDEEEGSYGPLSWVTIPSGESESGDQESENQTLEEPEPEEPEDEEEVEPEEAFQIARREALGMDPRPSGSELLEEESAHSRADAFRRKSYEQETIENVHDIIEEDTEPIDKFFDRPAGPSHAEVPFAHASYMPSEVGHPAAGDVAMAALGVGFVAVEVGRIVRREAHNLREKSHEMRENRRHASE